MAYIFYTYGSIRPVNIICFVKNVLDKKTTI